MLLYRKIYIYPAVSYIRHVVDNIKSYKLRKHLQSTCLFFHAKQDCCVMFGVCTFRPKVGGRTNSVSGRTSNSITCKVKLLTSCSLVPLLYCKYVSSVPSYILLSMTVTLSLFYYKATVRLSYCGCNLDIMIKFLHNIFRVSGKKWRERIFAG